MLAGREVPRETAGLLISGQNAPAAVILVTNEVGCGIVPDNELSRRFRDEAGRLNQQAAAAAGEVYWMAFGIPVRIK
jgi:adenosylcobinamide kinase/adenosylcobinamide-phosphate guanylyltransferase